MALNREFYNKMFKEEVTKEKYGGGGSKRKRCLVCNIKQPIANNWQNAAIKS